MGATQEKTNAEVEAKDAQPGVLPAHGNAKQAALNLAWKPRNPQGSVAAMHASFNFFTRTALAGLTALASMLARAEPASAGDPAEYAVSVDGRPAEVFAARTLDAPFNDGRWDFGGTYFFCNFDLSGPVEVRVVATNRTLRASVLRPAWPDVSIIIEDDHTALVRQCPGGRRACCQRPRGGLLRARHPPAGADRAGRWTDVVPGRRRGGEGGGAGRRPRYPYAERGHVSRFKK